MGRLSRTRVFVQVSGQVFRCSVRINSLNLSVEIRIASVDRGKHPDHQPLVGCSLKTRVLNSRSQSPLKIPEPGKRMGGKGLCKS